MIVGSLSRCGSPAGEADERGVEAGDTSVGATENAAGRGSVGADLLDACALLRALGAPHRLAIVLELADGPRCVHELVDDLGISQSLTSQHLRVLRTTGLVTSARRGKETVYRLADEHVGHIARDAVAHAGEPGRRPSADDVLAEEHPASPHARTGGRR